MKELDSFTVERLEELSEIGDMANDRYLIEVSEVRKLARIALAAKRAEPVAWFSNGAYYNTGRAALKDQAENPTPLYTTPQLNSQAGLGSWIKCSDQMPGNDERKPIAIYTGNYLGQGMFVASYDDDEFFDYWEGTEIKGVTHWMPLPAAPEKENG